MADETSQEIQVYLCFEPDQQVCAEKIDSWPCTNSDFGAYAARLSVEFESTTADSLKEMLRRQIDDANVTICVIAGPTFMNPWINWELATSKAGPKRNGLVGIMLKDYFEPPPAMVNSGAIFVPFKRDAVERAVAWAIEEERTSEDYTLQDE